MNKLYRYDKQANAMYINCNNVAYIKSIELSPSIILDLGVDNNNIVKVKGIEILDCKHIIDEFEELNKHVEEWRI